MASDRNCICGITDEHKLNGNLVFCATGDDVMPGNTFSVPCSPSGNEPATHWFCSWNRDAQGAAELEAMEAGTLPELPQGTAWGDVGLTEQEAQDAIDAMTVSVRVRGEPRYRATEHLADVLAAQGLQRIV